MQWNCIFRELRCRLFWIYKLKFVGEFLGLSDGWCVLGVPALHMCRVNSFSVCAQKMQILLELIKIYYKIRKCLPGTFQRVPLPFQCLFVVWFVLLQTGKAADFRIVFMIVFIFLGCHEVISLKSGDLAVLKINSVSFDILILCPHLDTSHVLWLEWRHNF